MAGCVMTWAGQKNEPRDFIVPVCLSVLCGLGIALAFELRFAFQIALAAGFIGTAVFFIIPNKRIMLAVAWILIHPLSLEKVFTVGRPLLPDFFPPTVVLSGSDIILFVLFITLLMEAAFTQKKVWFWSAALTPMAIFTLWAILVFFVRGSSVTSGLATVHTVKMLLFVLILSSAIRTREEFILIIVAVALAVGIQDIIVGISHATDKLFLLATTKLNLNLMTFTDSAGNQYVRTTGTMGYVNQEAVFLTFFVFPLLGLLSVKNNIWRTFGIAVIAAALIAVILTFSRSAWVSYALAILAIVSYMGIRRPFRRKHWITFIASVIVFVSILIIYQRPILNRIVHGDEGATDSRKRLMNLAIDLSTAHPLIGVGPGNFVSESLKMYPPSRLDTVWLKPDELYRDLMYRYSYGRLEIYFIKTKDNKTYVVPLPVHNKYLLVLSELGIIGLLLFIWFQWRIFQHIRTALQTKDHFLLWSALGIMGAFIASQSYMNLELFADDKTMAILLMVPVLALSLGRIVMSER